MTSAIRTCCTCLCSLLATAMLQAQSLDGDLVAANWDSPIVLTALDVSGRQLTYEDSTAFKLPVTLHETPRSVTVLDRVRIREQNFVRLEDTFRYVPGVFSRSQDGDSYHFLSRGFDMGPDQTMVDGFSGLLAGGTFSPSLFSVDRVVYLRGPAGLQYGAATVPGGVINLITKRPTERPFARAEVRAASYAGHGLDLGSNRSLEVSIDTGGPLTPDGKVTYRAAALVQNLGSYKDGINDRNRGLLAALTWKFGEDDRFELTPIFLWQRQPFGAGRAVSISPATSLSTADGLTGPIHTADLTPLSQNYSEGERVLENTIAGFDFRAALSDAWHAHVAYRFIQSDSDSNQFLVQTASLRQLEGRWVVSRRQAISEIGRQNHAFDLNTSYEFTPLAGAKNLTLLGFNGRFYQLTYSRAAATQPDQSPIDLYTGVPVSPLVDHRPALVNAFLNDDFYWNAYLQNQTSFADGRWTLTLGLGYGEQQFERDYSAVSAPPPQNLEALTATRKGDVTPNASLVFNVSPAVAVYASYSTSYSPADSSFENAAGQTGGFGPTTGTNLEVGAKLDLPASESTLTLSVFRTELDNVLVQSSPAELNPNGNRFYTQTGGGRLTKGIELGAETRPLPGWRVNATASYLDSVYRGEGRLRGSRTERTPPWAFSLYNRYDFAAGVLKNLGVSVGLIWQDQRWSAARTSAAPDPLLLPSYWRVDAGLFYRMGTHWDLALNLENVLDETYFVNGTTGAALELGAPRSLSLRVGYRF
ncbi:TonB-dependent siderophore receptor [Opitutus terrae]|uniref:TonB-dependent siderophore receptor n=1 Tax=Opitutus terrae (strain DSM 11246 / JCM 15787 / PB90-1) TaxID=452637 RepID=B1ZQT0_OPITP|nr:TonB-dependent receptor [Opitutus terrae]ACB77828.1 TonB-dependent siderophore receptor [Opitutus terrae PB90-1]